MSNLAFPVPVVKLVSGKYSVPHGSIGMVTEVRRAEIELPDHLVVDRALGLIGETLKQIVTDYGKRPNG